MEESKNPFMQRTSDNFYITNTLKTVDSTEKKKLILDPSQLNLSNSIEIIKNKNLNSSRKKREKEYTLNSFRKPNSKIKKTLYKTFKNNLKENPITPINPINIKLIQNEDNNENNNMLTPSSNIKINSKTNTQRKITNIDLVQVENNKNSKLLRLKTNSFTRPRLSNFSLNNKQSHKIIFNRNIGNSQFEANKHKNLLKSEGDEKTIATTIFTDRNQKEVKFNSISRQNSLNNRYYNNIKKVDEHSRKRRNSTIVNSNLLFTPSNSKKLFLGKRNKKHRKKNVTPAASNPLQVSEEDKIFDEMKKYLCFKYEQKQKRLNRNHIHNNHKSEKSRKNIPKEKLNVIPKIKKLKFRLQNEDQKKLDYLYLATTKISRKIYRIKRKKDKQDLNQYQNNMLDIIKPSISDVAFSALKKRLINIRITNNKKYQNNYRRLREIENEEEEVINEFNQTCTRCLSNFQSIRENKEMIHSANLTIKLPLLNFISCLKKKKKQPRRYKY